MRQAIITGVAALLGLFLWLAPDRATAGGDPRVDALARALELVEAEDWDGALAAAAAAGDPIVSDIVEWHRLRSGTGAPEDYLSFLARRSDWPGLPYLRRKGERALDGAPAADVLRFFVYGPPQTAVGALAHARALRILGREDEAVQAARRGFLRFSMEAATEAAYRAEFPAAVRGRDWARLDAMLWKGARADAERLLDRVSAGRAALARARIMLRAGDRGVDAAIEAVPASLRDDPGLAFERFRWRVTKGRGRAAEEILRARSVSAEALGRPAAWAKYRLRLAHAAMREGRWNDAYEMAAAHHLSEGAAFAELEWLAGYVALRGQRRPGVAAEHFARFRRAVATPISLGRGGYWLGRAWEAMGDADRARHHYAEGARYQTSFYGQLAAEKAGVPPDPRLAGTEVFDSWRTAPFLQSSVLKAALLLRAAGDPDLAARFFAHLSESLERDEIGRLLAMILDLGEPYAAVIVGKRAARAGHELVPGYFPLTRLTEVPLSVPPELALAIARRESEFRHQRISPAGARGLMQLMPRTARAMARELGLEYSEVRLLDDWAYNARLGTAYLAHLSEKFGGNVVLVAAAYNAGPSRVEAWIEEQGDPRRPGVDPIDWIEKVPFPETRNYIMRVAESLAIYRARLSGRVVPFRLSSELKAGR